MNGLSKSFALAVTSLSMAVIAVVAFAWFGPGLDRITPPASAALFDEGLVQRIYEETSSAVVDINVDLEEAGSFNRLGAGSGFLIDMDGHIVTNNHVIQNADRVRVSFQDRTSVDAEVLGTNPANDLALIKVDPEAVANITPLTLGDSDSLRPGQLAIAIGSPFGLGGSVTVGVISGVDRTITSDIARPISGVVQTDALINPGNSGGPLLNRDGDVVGINTAIQVSSPIRSPRNLGQGSIGFAVPTNTLNNLLPRLKAKGEIRPPWLGISAATLEPLLVEMLELPVDSGVYVTQIMSGSPAKDSGLIPSGTDQQGAPTRGGDIIVSVNGVPVVTVADLITELNKHLPGDEISLTVVRDGDETAVPLTLGEWPKDREFHNRTQGPMPNPHDRFGPGNPGIPLPDLFPKNDPK